MHYFLRITFWPLKNCECTVYIEPETNWFIFSVCIFVFNKNGWALEVFGGARAHPLQRQSSILIICIHTILTAGCVTVNLATMSSRRGMMFSEERFSFFLCGIITNLPWTGFSIVWFVGNDLVYSLIVRFVRQQKTVIVLCMRMWNKIFDVLLWSW